MIIKDYYYKGGSTMVTKSDAYTGYEFQDDKNILEDKRIRTTI